MIASHRWLAAVTVAVHAIGLGWLAGTPAFGQQSYPMVMSLHPAAAQIGATTEHTVHSRYSMYGATEVYVSGEGVVGEVALPEVKEGAKPPNLQAMTIRFHVAPDAQPGVRDFRILTPRGASTLGQLVVAREPIVVESKDNSPAEPQQTEAPATWCGVIERAEDVDCFQFAATQGQSLAFHVRSMRLQNKIHDLQTHSDPIITLRNEAGSTLATSDNVFFGDPFLQHTFADDGVYTLEIRDVRYQGNKYWTYSIEASARPFAATAHPLAVRWNEPTAVELVGWQLGDTPEAEAVLTPAASDDTPASEFVTASIDVGDHQVCPPMIGTALPTILENEGENSEPKTGQAFAAPAMITGRIETENDVDCFRFPAKKGERWSFEVMARRRQSALDSHLRVLDANGKQLQLNDDLRLGKRTSSDSQIENWTAPADGEYVVEVRDLHLRGGEAFVYALQVTRAEPYFELYLDTDKTLLTPGLSAVIFARVVRKNGFQGPVELSIDGLPDKVTASCGRILGGSKDVDGCIVLTAAPDAQPQMKNVTVRGEATWTDDDGEQTWSCEAQPYQETYQPGGGRGHFPVATHAVSVGAPADILEVNVSQQDIKLKPGDSIKIDVELVRSEGFDKNVSLDVIYKHLNSVYGNSLPAGVTVDAAQSKLLLTKGAGQGHITFKASADAEPVAAQQLAVMANVSLNFVMKASYASRPLWITIESDGKPKDGK